MPLDLTGREATVAALRARFPAWRWSTVRGFARRYAGTHGARRVTVERRVPMDDESHPGLWFVIEVGSPPAPLDEWTP